jgi:hypothetical protein
VSTGQDDLISALAQSDLHRWLNRPNNRWVKGRQLEAALIRVSADFVLESSPRTENVSILGDKTPAIRCDVALRRLHLIYPDAKVIMIVRDGRDALLSQRFQAFIDQPETLRLRQLALRRGLRRRPDRYGADGKSIFDRGWLERSARDWVRSTVDGHRIGQRLYRDSYFSLRYEDLLAQPLDELVKLWRFLGADSDPAAMEALVRAEMARNPAADWHREKAPDLTRGLPRGIAGGWRAWFTQADAQQFLKCAGVGLNQWDYPDA